MYNIEYKTYTTSCIAGLILVAVSSILICVFGFMSFPNSVKMKDMDKETKAFHIIDNCNVNNNGDNTCKPIYEYSVDGVNYTCHSKISSSNINHNKNKVYYNSNKPSSCITEFDNSITNIFKYVIIVPIIIFIIGIIFVIKNIIRNRRYIYLSKNGTLYKDLSFDIVKTNESVNGVKLSYPKVTWNDKVIKGEKTTDDLKDYDKIDLLIDPNNSKNYYLGFNITKRD